MIGRVLGWWIERSSRDKSLSELARKLEASKTEVAAKIRQGADTPANRAQAAHIIGIERWGQRRLRIPLGEPPTHDEMDDYCPPESLSMNELRDAFERTRQETLSIVIEFQERGLAPETTAPHNDMGEFSLRGWLAYLNGHAAREADRIKA